MAGQIRHGHLGQILLGFTTVALAIPGVLSFVFAMVAEKTAQRAPGLLYDQETRKSTCHYNSNLTLYLGCFSTIYVLIEAKLSIRFASYPYLGKALSPTILWKKRWVIVAFSIISTAMYLCAQALLLWALFLEFRNRHNNVHSGLIDQCPTTKSGLFGWAGILAFGATVFFLMLLMLILPTIVRDVKGRDARDICHV